MEQEKWKTGNQIEGLLGYVYQLYLSSVCVSELIVSCVFLTSTAALIAEVTLRMILMAINLVHFHH